MSDRGPSDPRDEFEPTQYFPPIRDAEPPSDLPPIGSERDPEPTRVMPTWDEPDDRTTVMPPAGAGGAFPPGGGDGGYPPEDTTYVAYEDEEPDPWYRQRGPMLAIAAGVLALILAIIAFVVLSGDDDGDDEVVTSTPTPTSTTTTTLPPTTQPPPPPTTEPPTTPPSTTTTSTTTTTLPPTTTSSTTTTTTTTTTTLPPTTTTTTTSTTTTQPAPAQRASAWDVIVRAPGLSEMRDAIQRAELVEEFSAPGITVLAPTNGAFEQLRGAVGGAAVLDDPEQLRPLLLRHLVPEALSADDIWARDSLPTAQGTDLTVDGDARTIGDQNASIIQADDESENGAIVHAVDAVLV